MRRLDTQQIAATKKIIQRNAIGPGSMKGFPKAEDLEHKKKRPRIEQPILAPQDKGKGSLQEKGDVWEGKKRVGSLSRKQNCTALALLELLEVAPSRPVSKALVSRTVSSTQDTGQTPTVKQKAGIPLLRVPHKQGSVTPQIQKSPQLPVHRPSRIRIKDKSNCPGTLVWKDRMLGLFTKERRTVEESFLLSAGAGAARAIVEMKKEAKGAEVAIQEDDGSSTLQHSGSSGETSSDVSRAVNDVVDDIQRHFYPHEVGLEEVVSKMPMWDDEWEPTPTLLRYWAGGSPSPPIFENEGMEAKFVDRFNEFLRRETVHVSREKQRAEEYFSSRTPPMPPDPVPMLALYHLHVFKDEVILPFSLDHSSGEDFTRNGSTLSRLKSSRNDFRDACGGGLQRR